MSIGTVVILAIVAWFCIVCFRQYAKEAESKRLMAIATKIVANHATALRRRADQTIHVGDYGESVQHDWHREMKHFYLNVFSPELMTHSPNHVAYHPDALRDLCYDLVIAEVNALRPLMEEQYDDGQHLLDPIAFERWCAARLQANGWEARTTKGSGDQGVDVLAERDGVRVVLQCKLYSMPIGNKAVQEAHAAKVYEGADMALVVTNSSYTKSARALAQRTGVGLLHMDDLHKFDG